MFDLIVIVRVPEPDDMAPVADALARMRPLCLAEDGCVSWEAYQSQGDPGCFVLVERWASRTHWEAHDSGDAIQKIYRHASMFSRFTPQQPPAPLLARYTLHPRSASRRNSWSSSTGARLPWPGRFGGGGRWPRRAGRVERAGWSGRASVRRGVSRRCSS